VFRKETSLTDVDNVLSGFVRRCSLGGWYLHAAGGRDSSYAITLPGGFGTRWIHCIQLVDATNEIWNVVWYTAVEILCWVLLRGWSKSVISRMGSNQASACTAQKTQSNQVFGHRQRYNAHPGARFKKWLMTGPKLDDASAGRQTFSTDFQLMPRASIWELISSVSDRLHR
jgi:hypothetical protein